MCSVSCTVHHSSKLASYFRTSSAVTAATSMELHQKPASSDGRKAQYRIETKLLSYYQPLTDAKQVTWLWCQVHGAARAILKDVTCEAQPGEVLAIVGPSGAGKTTLLSILAGMVHPRGVTGRVLVNGQDMDVSRFRRVSGYVKQHDSLFPLLTVRECLTYSARLRLKAARVHADSRVAELLKELGLDHVANSRIGGGGHGGRGISGGERRRVSIGVDLVHDPAVLLLDEPTSGLDSASAFQIIALLKSMAAVQGKTVVLTIHQPGFRILELIDRVLLISGGAVRHNGSMALLEKRLSDAGHSIPPHVNVLEYAMDLMGSLVVSESPPPPSPPDLMASLGGNPIGGGGDRIMYANSRVLEVLILGERFCKNIVRTKQLFTARMIQSVLAGLALGTIFMNVKDAQVRVGFFAFSLTFLLSSTTEGLPIFLQERRILMTETTRGAYRVSSYVMANALVFLPFLFVVALLYSVPVYWLVGLRRETDGFLYFSFVIWLVMLMANSFVSFFSALVPNFIMGNSMVAGFMGSFFLFSGYFISKENIPKYWAFMHYLSLFKYPFEAFLINEYGGSRGWTQCLGRAPGGVCVLDGSAFLKQQGLREQQKWVNLGVMASFICGYRILCFVVLWLRCHRLRK